MNFSTARLLLFTFSCGVILNDQTAYAKRKWGFKKIGPSTPSNRFTTTTIATDVHKEYEIETTTTLTAGHGDDGTSEGDYGRLLDHALVTVNRYVTLESIDYVIRKYFFLSIGDEEGTQAFQANSDPVVTATIPSKGFEIETNTRRRRNDFSTTARRTAAGELAQRFQEAVVAVNKNKQDVHVGKLLDACEELAVTIHKIGFAKSASDILKNVQKVRDVYGRIPNKNERDSINALLQYEMELGVHENGNLSESSAAMGFMWLARIINYQYNMFRHMIEGGDNVDPYQASVYAYEQTLKPHLSWTVRKIVQGALMTLKAMKKSTILSKVGGFSIETFGHYEEQATIRDLTDFLDVSKTVFLTCQQALLALNLESIKI